jgi:hypothetical protein
LDCTPLLAAKAPLEKRPTIITTVLPSQPVPGPEMYVVNCRSGVGRAPSVLVCDLVVRWRRSFRHMAPSSNDWQKSRLKRVVTFIKLATVAAAASNDRDYPQTETLGRL